MKLYLLLLLTTFSNLNLQSQSNEVWNAFYNKDTTLIGYKDKNDVVKIEPKFNSYSIAKKFEHIIAVTEDKNDTWNSYYLTKSGKVVGNDSLYVFDNGFDCENEGFIRFRDRKTDKTGMFDKTGKIAIPAIYNDLTKVKNGMIIGLKDAEKKYWGEHYSWIGGKEVLIDTLNNVLVEDFKYDNSINFYTLEKSKAPHTDTTRKSFLAKDGTYYSFVDFEKEFSQWLKKELLHELTLTKLIACSYDTITWETPNKWKKTEKQKFITDNFTILKKGLLEVLDPKTDYFISRDGLNKFMFEGAEFDTYFNNCEESKEWIYPTMSVILSHRTKKELSQNHYVFLRTDKGYKLISLSIRDHKLK
jgi:hypothetical protein